MPAQKLNLIGDYVVEQGSNYKITLTLKDQDGNLYPLTGTSCKAQIREDYSSGEAISFKVDIDTETSQIILSLTGEETALIAFPTGVWDCEFTDSDGTLIRLLQGKITISKEVTR